MTNAEEQLSHLKNRHWEELGRSQDLSSEKSGCFGRKAIEQTTSKSAWFDGQLKTSKETNQALRRRVRDLLQPDAAVQGSVHANEKAGRAA